MICFFFKLKRGKKLSSRRSNRFNVSFLFHQHNISCEQVKDIPHHCLIFSHITIKSIYNQVTKQTTKKTNKN